MGKNHESFNKKERQKKKLQKRKDKEQRKEERKSSVTGSKQSLDDMIAYVDENGNISSTPPDPAKKKEIKLESIEIATAPTIHVPQDALRNGKVKFFNESKGFGFIHDIDSGEDIFVHVNNLEQPVQENDKVTFKTEKSFKGLTAIEVALAK